MSLILGLLASGIVGSIVFVILCLLRPATERLFSKTWHYYSLFVPLFFLLGGALIAPDIAIEAPRVMPEINIAANVSQTPLQMPYFTRPIIEGTVVQNSPAPSRINLSHYILMLGYLE